ncbi:hypothetical protein APHNYW_1619 [Anaplasma phagocytophilum str. ApNYW]|nr:hypothetical protein APHNYW_1619 [Anaplasma phagocytophilum str. ApNYW]
MPGIAFVQEFKLCYWKVARNVIIAKICSSSFNNKNLDCLGSFLLIDVEACPNLLQGRGLL